ncbi:hypothetical protein [Calothrix sp. FACHB-168]|nr:hypothetical protein [Calothrix sp. FACHB-168]MBD2205308.1 hypothetical protein [Calothrix sp. FACHB-168]
MNRVSTRFILPCPHAQCPMPNAQCPMPNAQQLDHFGNRYGNFHIN